MPYDINRTEHHLYNFVNEQKVKETQSNHLENGTTCEMRCEYKVYGRHVIGRHFLRTGPTNEEKRREYFWRIRCSNIPNVRRKLELNSKNLRSSKAKSVRAITNESLAQRALSLSAAIISTGLDFGLVCSRDVIRIVVRFLRVYACYTHRKIENERKIEREREKENHFNGLECHF